MVFWPNSNGGGSLRETSQQDLAKKYGIEAFEHPYADSGVKNIGFAPTTNKWYGWSHRAIFGFTVGDMVKQGDIIAQGGEFSRPDRSFPVGFTAKTLTDARAMAAAFADGVS
jgi:hypothetical protein